MDRHTDRRRTGTRRDAAVGAVLGLLLLAACASGARGVAPPPPVGDDHDPVGRASVRADVPVRSAALGALDVPAAPPPVALVIPALEVTVPIDPVGVRDDGQMEIPPLAERAGWYRFGAAPGDAQGTAVIAAHVDSVASGGLGPFSRLAEAAVGDVVEVTRADGSVLSYVVTAVERRAKPEVAWADVFVRDGGARLVLVTCGGTFHRDVGRYSDNVIVTAQPAGGG